MDNKMNTQSEAPLPAQLITQPEAFGQAVHEAAVPAWHYWPAPVLATLLGSAAYALVMHSGAQWVATEVTRQSLDYPVPAMATSALNGLGSLFLLSIMFGAFWGMGWLLSRKEQHLPLTPLVCASFTLPIPLYVLCIVLSLMLPHPSFVGPEQNTDVLQLQKTSLGATARGLAGQCLLWGSLGVTLAQCLLLARSLSPLTNRAWFIALSPLPIMILIQLLNVGVLLAGLFL